MLLLLSNCAPPQDEAFDISQSVTSGDEVPSQWASGKNAFPLQLSLSSNFTSAEKETIKSMAINWSDSVSTPDLSVTNSNDKLIFFNTNEDIKELNSVNLNDYKDSTMGVYKVTQWNSDLPPTALAVTQIYGNRQGDKIIIQHADILLNYENFSFSTEHGFGYDLATVVVHEMGHFLGLYHDYSSTDESIMFPSINRFTINRYPKTRDVNNIESKYQIKSYSQQIARSPAGLQLDGQNDIEIGQEVVIRQELHADGKCHHRYNGKLIHHH